MGARSNATTVGDPIAENSHDALVYEETDLSARLFSSASVEGRRALLATPSPTFVPTPAPTIVPTPGPTASPLPTTVDVTTFNQCVVGAFRAFSHPRAIP